MTPEPPRLAAWLAARRLTPEWRDYILGDLAEEFHLRAEVSLAAARRWYWRQAFRGLLAGPPTRSQTPQPLSRKGFDMSSFVADLVLAVRVFRRAPSYALAVVVVLALGIGANSAIFTIVNAVLLRPLPFAESDRLVRLFHTPPQDTFPGMKTFAVSAANFYDWQREARSFDGMALYRFRQLTLTGLGEPEALVATAVGAGFFEVVGTRPLLGRSFAPDEDQPGRAHVVMISEGFWRSHLGGDAHAIGRTLTLGGDPYQIVGVMPAAFSVKAWGATSLDLWVPSAYTDAERHVRNNHNDDAIARLKPGVTLAAAQSELDGIAARLARQYPDEDAGWGAVAMPLATRLIGDLRPTLMLLLAAVALLLSIACANAGNLMFTRALARGKEIAIRTALGAGRRRVFQQLLIEGIVLAVAGGALGLAIAQSALAATGAMLADQLPQAANLAMDWRVLSFVAIVAIGAGALSGTLPALRAGRANVNDSLRLAGRNDNAAFGLRTRRLLIVGEVAMSLMLLVGAGVMIRSLSALRNVSTGFDAAGVLTMNVAVPETKYKTPAERTLFFDHALAGIRALPGVDGAGLIDDLPMLGGSVQPIVIDGAAPVSPRDQPTVSVRRITPGYLRSMRIPVLAGRDVTDTDRDVMLVSESAAKLIWKAANPAGTRAVLPLQDTSQAYDVVGVVGDVKQGELASTTAPTVYWFTRERDWSSLTFVVRTLTAPALVSKPAVGVIRAIDPDQPVQQIQTMSEVVDRTMTSQRMSTLLMGVFAAIAVALASVGIYTVLAFIVRGRSREIGIRSALGARTGDVVRLVIAEGMLPASVGIVIGGVAALGLGGLMRTLVFGISASDPVTLGAAAAVLALVALFASAVPAYRASRVDPLKALRDS